MRVGAVHTLRLMSDHHSTVQNKTQEKHKVIREVYRMTTTVDKNSEGSSKRHMSFRRHGRRDVAVGIH